jgi:hypothetical protein
MKSCHIDNFTTGLFLNSSHRFLHYVSTDNAIFLIQFSQLIFERSNKMDLEAAIATFLYLSSTYGLPLKFQI